MTEPAMAGPTRPWRRRLLPVLGVLFRRYDLERKIALVITVAAIASGLATVIIWTGATDFGPHPNTVVVLLYLDVILLLLLAALVVRRLVTVWAEGRRGHAGSGLHVRMVVLFSLLAVTPAIVVAVFSALFLHFGVQSWFSERVRTAVEASSAVAAAYLQEHRQGIRADVFAMANDLNRDAPALMRDPKLFTQELTAQANLRSLSEALVIDSSGRVLARSPLSLTLSLDLVPPESLAQAAEGQIVVLTDERDERVRAIVKLDRYVDAYLFVARFIEPSVLRYIQETEMAVAQYQRLEASREGILITFVMIFGVVALLLLLAAVWIGIALASQISKPISALAGAAERVRKGDMSARVSAVQAVGEIGTLSRAFNRMTTQLQTQQQGLIDANRDLDERRRFTEAVLSGVSAGVIGLDAAGRINLPNRRASALLDIDLEQRKGEPMGEVVTEMASLLVEASDHPDRQAQSEMRLVRNGQTYTFLVRIVAERLDEQVLGYVLTFDDITALVQAERKAAWADVARRIAHEIKNPLTPIQLASERLKRRYLKEIKSDPETFKACTETIGRQVEDIGRMVDEFSAFARMPRPKLERHELADIVQPVVMMERNRTKGIRIDVNLSREGTAVLCDQTQVSQALTNILKNAGEAVIARKPDGDTPLPPGRIRVVLERQRAPNGGETVVLAVEDNGRGLPDEDRDRLTEPYVTTHAKGTGLGLAIVKKIMEDHTGSLILDDRDGGGTRALLVFPSLPDKKAGETPGARAERPNGKSAIDSAPLASELDANG
jgi:two-component system, NtrC family, nitrogen regulation sensor histidine kinase NtrY